MSNTARGNDWREMPLTNLKISPHEQETQTSENGGWLLNIKGFLGRLCEELSKHLSFKKNNSLCLTWTVKILTLAFVISLCMLYFLVSIGDPASAASSEKITVSDNPLGRTVEENSKRQQQQALLLKLLQQTIPRLLPLEEKDGKGNINETHEH